MTEPLSPEEHPAREQIQREHRDEMNAKRRARRAMPDSKERAYQLEWNAKNAEKRRAYRKTWDDKNPDYRAEYRATNREVLNERNAAQMRAANQAKRDERKRKDKNASRLAQWAKDNPEKRREARERYRALNPDAHRAAQRDYYHRNKEAINARKKAREIFQDPEKLRARRRRENATWRATHARSEWEPSQEQRERYAGLQNEKKKLDRRLKTAGLPPRHVQRRLVSERRASLAAADHFFSRDRSADEFLKITEGDWAAHKLGDGSVPPELLRTWARTVERIHERGKFRDGVQKYIQKNGKRLRSEIALDNRARELRGKGPLNEVAELHLRARSAVFDAIRGVSKEDGPESRSMVRRRPAAPGNNAPHIFPGGVSPHGPSLS